MSFKHGVFNEERPTALLGIVEVPSALPFVVGTAPVHTVAGEQSIGKLVKLESWQDALDTFGWVHDYGRYTLMEFLYSYFRIFGFGPVLAVNVFDPTLVAGEEAIASKDLAAGAVSIAVAGTLVVGVYSDEAGETAYAETSDYTVSYDEDGYPTIHRVSNGTIPADDSSIYVGTKTIAADKAGVNAAAVVTGFDAIDTAFAQYGDVPAILAAPGYSQDPTVEAAMIAKTTWGGAWKAFALTDVDTLLAEADTLAEVAAWKSTNSYTDPNQDVYWPKVTLGTDQYHLSSIMAGALAKMDQENGGVPYDGASNVSLPIDGAVNAAGTAIWLTEKQANDSLGQNGVTTAVNLGPRGWVSWGNRTGAYPGSTDPKDMWRNFRRMLNWLENSVRVTMLQKVDRPGNYRQIEAITNSIQIWLNGLAASGALIGNPKIEFRREDNPATELVDGHYVFAVTVTPPTPMEAITFSWQIDVTQFETLFA